MKLCFQPAVVLYPINNNTNFNAIRIILFNYKNVYINVVCVEHPALYRSACIEVQTNCTVAFCLSSAESFFHTQASRHFIAIF